MKKTRILAAVLCLALLAGMLPGTASAAAGDRAFRDVEPDDWFFGAVTYVNAKGLMNGVGHNRFDPQGKATRAMIVTLLYRLEAEPEPEGTASFPDVPEGAWYTQAVKWAGENGIVKGYSDGKFYPSTDITREQMATIFYRYTDFKGYDMSRTGDLGKFSDSGTISDYAVTALSWANGVGLINGMTETTISPKSTATRAQVATILMRYCQTILGDEGMTKEYRTEDGELRAIVGEITDETVSDASDALDVINGLADYVGVNNGLDGEIVTATEGSDTVYTLNQEIDGLTVEGNEVILLVDKDENAEALYTYIDPRAEDVDTAPSASVGDAASAVAAVKAYLTGKYSDAFTGSAGLTLADYLDAHSFDAELLIYAPGDSEPRLCWKVLVHAPEASQSTYLTLEEVDETMVVPMLNEVVYILANGDNAGECLLSYDQDEGASYPTQAKDVKGNDRTILVLGGYDTEYLYDDDRGIATYQTLYTQSGFLGLHIEPIFPGRLISKGSRWNPSGVSAHANMEAVYDYYNTVLHRRSYDGRGANVTVSIEYAPGNGPISFLYGAIEDTNAFWSSGIEQFVFHNAGDFEAALDVCGHEFTHAVINTIVGGTNLNQTLTYYGQSGALNESYADIMGSLIEGHGRSNENRWLLGEDSSEGALRSMKDPGAYNKPDHYSALFSREWDKKLDRYPERDNEGVHIFSSIFSHAAYLMMTDSRTRSVPDKTWAQIFYGSLFLLSTNAHFADARLAVETTAERLGFSKNQLAAVSGAFDAVGIPEMEKTVTEDDDLWLRREAFAQIVRLYEAKYGEAVMHTWEDMQNHRTDFTGYPVSYGLYYADLIDLDGDGMEELVLGYSDSTQNMYYSRGIDVWTFRNGKAVKYETQKGGMLMYGVDSGSICIMDYPTGRYIVIGSAMTGSNHGPITAYGFNNGLFGPVGSITGSDVYSHFVNADGYDYWDFGFGEPVPYTEIFVYGLSDTDAELLADSTYATKVRLGILKTYPIWFG